MHTRRHVADRSMLPALRIGGFTLIEMAFVIVIASTLLLIGVKTISSLAVGAANRATSERLSTVHDALQAHVNRFGRLPCPDMGAAPDLTNFDGRESPTCASPADDWGVLPFVTLDITRADAQDGWGRPFLYQVSANWANLTPTLVGFDAIDRTIGSVSPTLGAITVLEKRADGTQVGTVTGVVAVVVSAGLNGFGGIGDKAVSRAVARTTPPGADELDNTRLAADATPTQFISRASTDSTAGTGAFDDVLLYVTGPSMVNKALESTAFKTEISKIERCYRETKQTFSGSGAACTPPATAAASCAVNVFSSTSTATVAVFPLPASPTPVFSIRMGTSVGAGTYTFSRDLLCP